MTIDRMLLGALAGIGGTIVMTAAMNRLQPVLRPGEQYPMPPREPATRHPFRHNALIIAVHLLWGAATALALRELEEGSDVVAMNAPAHAEAPVP